MTGEGECEEDGQLRLLRPRPRLVPAMFLVMHSVSGALRLLAPPPPPPEAPLEAATCPHCDLGLDTVPPLPQARRRSCDPRDQSPRTKAGCRSLGRANTAQHSSDCCVSRSEPRGQGLRILRTRHKSDQVPRPGPARRLGPRQRPEVKLDTKDDIIASTLSGTLQSVAPHSDNITP